MARAYDITPHDSGSDWLVRFDHRGVAAAPGPNRSADEAEDADIDDEDDDMDDDMDDDDLDDDEFDDDDADDDDAEEGGEGVE